LTRTRLLEAAEYVFTRDGFVATRVADIVKEAKVSHGTFYTYFDSKEQIFQELAEAVIDEMQDAVNAVPTAGTAMERLREGAHRYVDSYEQHAAFLAQIEQVASFNADIGRTRLELRRRYLAGAKRTIARIFADGESHLPPLDIDATALLLGGAVEQLCYAWFVLGESLDREATLVALESVLTRSLGVDVSDGSRSEARAGVKGGRRGGC
jgi:AcrR family transcriptional regulator